MAHHGVSVGIAYLTWIDTDMVRDADRYGTTGTARQHAAVPPVVMRLSRRRLPRLEAEEPFEATGLLRAGGEADSDAT